MNRRGFFSKFLPALTAATGVAAASATSVSSHPKIISVPEPICTECYWTMYQDRWDRKHTKEGCDNWTCRCLNSDCGMYGISQPMPILK